LCAVGRNRQGSPVAKTRVFVQVTTTTRARVSTTTTGAGVTRADGSVDVVLPGEAKGAAGSRSTIQAFTDDARASGVKAAFSGVPVWQVWPGWPDLLVMAVMLRCYELRMMFSKGRQRDRYNHKAGTSHLSGSTPLLWLDVSRSAFTVLAIVVMLPFVYNEAGASLVPLLWQQLQHAGWAVSAQGGVCLDGLSTPMSRVRSG